MPKKRQPSATKARRKGRVADKSRRPDSADQKRLEDEAQIDAPAETGSERRSVCYNPACADYRRERPYDEKCGCTRTRVAPSTVSF
jgi:hypothetical protein